MFRIAADAITGSTFVTCHQLGVPQNLSWMRQRNRAAIRQRDQPMQAARLFGANSEFPEGGVEENACSDQQESHRHRVREAAERPY